MYKTFLQLPRPSPRFSNWFVDSPGGLGYSRRSFFCSHPGLMLDNEPGMPAASAKPRSLFNLLFWPLLTILGVVSVVGALRWGLTLDIDFNTFATMDWRWLLAALVLQFAAFLIAVLTWQLNLWLHGERQISFMQAFTMIGITTLGKYTPGKVWGLLVRGAALYKLTSRKHVALLASVVEQSAILHCSVVIGLICYLATEPQQAQQTGLLAGFVLLALVSVLVASHSGFLILRLSQYFIRGEALPLDRHSFRNSYVTVFLLMSTIWVLATAALYCCISAFLPAVNIALPELQIIVIMSYLAGFLAFFTVAGLGVREGVMVAMLGTHMDLPLALYIAALHRLVTLVPEIVLGSVALLASWSTLKADSAEPDLPMASKRIDNDGAG